MVPSPRVLVSVFFVSFLLALSLPASAAEILYTASFQWKNAPGATSRPMRLVIERNSHPRFTESAVVARIWVDNHAEAVCQVTHLETSDPAKPRAASVDMSCRSVAFGTLGAPATVFFQPGKSVLRFGTWLQGYEQATLTVERDRSARLLQVMAPSPVRLAESR